LALKRAVAAGAVTGSANVASDIEPLVVVAERQCGGSAAPECRICRETPPQ
jgi:hypothetical protein